MAAEMQSVDQIQDVVSNMIYDMFAESESYTMYVHPVVQGYAATGYRLCETLGTDQWGLWCSVAEPFFRIQFL